MKVKFQYLFLFVSALVLFVPVVWQNLWAIYLTKPFIGLSLLGAVFTLMPMGSIKNVLLAGIALSFLGDMFLMFEGETFFLIGLGFFLGAQILYTLLFSKIGSRPHGSWKARFWILGILVYLSLFLFYLEPLVGELFYPIVIYAIAISAMLSFSIGLLGKIRLGAAIMIVFGAAFFVLSDSILAINQFANPVENSRIMVMSTYLLAQYGIVFGVIKELEPKN